MQFRGIIPALVTPFTADQQLDEQALRNLIENLLNAGVHGLFVLGTNGEFFTLSESEKLKIALITVEAAAGRVPVVVGTGAFATHEVIEMNKKMIDVGADALSIITPYFNAISQSELIKHYTAIADAAELPLMMYNIPAKTGMSIGIGAVATLSQHPQIKGIKDSAGNFDALVQMMQYRSDDFAVFAGTDSLIYWNLLAGGDGAIAATANAVPEVVMSIWNNFQSGNHEAARAAQEALRPLRDAFALGTMPVVLKTATQLLNVPVGPCRAPVQPLDAAALEKLQNLLAVYRQA
ncbi:MULTISPECIES: 4-hydroxy-tetrahydrodipicolinate synthase [Pseudomonas syringae group genomosp. 2]|uniref:4-hydroxy-tetrahydrodipicolinate synthase n=3 Tax=Pseudomonas syringae group genomosp. 2 TaxID=251698 RepID=A0A0P9XBS4_9PSED|nr:MULTISPECIES: 4-hydroxy-tetrahydrodipicolinate synthase [Pseudomonas syringae group genomosp. 2]KPX92572.1 4-hydroxy-tetrahydrodipicolinate synthase [Pseudomonas meliae]KWT15854.1 dihydrodipicolinate synthase family protein [Pseudomonas amygdali pv. aesculi]KWT17056.1 dihydrodipicolinate synthase family protein [Pseudomonas amygdali pv. aesculi]KWT17922.1 dihydrodipicolinate synthase family protein [Pseudomonas amygdali pv. aesculi]KWT20533.1 dihydrodipicolinate synthase family protein [Pse